MYIRFKHIHTFYVSDVRIVCVPLKYINIVSFIVGLLSAFGFLLVANFQVPRISFFAPPLTLFLSVPPFSHLLPLSLSSLPTSLTHYPLPLPLSFTLSFPPSFPPSSNSLSLNKVHCIKVHFLFHRTTMFLLYISLELL